MVSISLWREPLPNERPLFLLRLVTAVQSPRRPFSRLPDITLAWFYPFLSSIVPTFQIASVLQRDCAAPLNAEPKNSGASSAQSGASCVFQLGSHGVLTMASSMPSNAKNALDLETRR
jgi:hypothetical protein